MIRLAEAGKVKTVIVKDMSRMGRDYLKVGYYTESFFAERDIRYIAINDGVDSDKGDNDFTPFRNLFNDFYARDTSKKIRAVMRAKGNAGEHLCTNPPYGYIKDPADKKKWIVDEDAAEIVKRIFALCIAGKGPMQIAKLLTAEHVLTVKAHYAQRPGKPAHIPQHPARYYRGTSLCTGAGVTGEQAPPQQDRKAGIVFWIALLCGLRGQAVFLYDKQLFA